MLCKYLTFVQLLLTLSLLILFQLGCLAYWKSTNVGTEVYQYTINKFRSSNVLLVAVFSNALTMRVIMSRSNKLTIINLLDQTRWIVLSCVILGTNTFKLVSPGLCSKHISNEMKQEKANWNTKNYEIIMDFQNMLSNKEIDYFLNTT